ncbi:MAG: ATP-binding protein [bacterium]|nr:ATP-binding protein [bacterium]
MQPWYKVVVPRKEVREGRSFNPDEFAIALEQVVSGDAPEDYRKPAQFFARTCFTRALTEHAGMVLRRLAGETENAAPVMALLTQFGGGKTHTLAALYHMVKRPREVESIEGVRDILSAAGVDKIPAAKVAVFVGNAWDPSEENPTPWIDVARQLAGTEGVDALGPEAREKAPGTASLRKMIEAAGGSVLVLCDEVLNYLSRHKDRASDFRAFLGNLVRTMTGTTGCAAMVSLPQSKPEMDDWELRWQDLISKEIGRVAKQLIANDESEISEVVRRRLFENLGGERLRRNVCRAYADWCFERSAQLPPELAIVDSASTEQKARDFLQARFEACYPFHPAALSVFQRKWQALPQYQQTRGTLAMFAQWISRAFRDGYQSARTEPLITLGSAPLEVPDFRSLVLGQLGEPRLAAAIGTDIAGDNAHSRALDADTQGPLKDIHRRVGTAILFESSGGQVEKLAHLPELRFALGEPEVDTTSVDTAAMALEDRAFFIRRVGTDGFQIRHQPTLKKVVNDRRASLDEEGEVQPTIRKLVKKLFEQGASIPLEPFPADSTLVPDSPRLTLVVADPEWELDGNGGLRPRIAEWTRKRGQSDRLYPGSLIWCIRKPGRDLRDAVEELLAWRRVQREVQEGTLGSDFDKSDLADIGRKVTEAKEAADDEVWAGYRYVALAQSPPSEDAPVSGGSRNPDGASPADGLRIIDLGAGHASGSETLCGRIIAALKSEAMLNESVGAGYIDRNWPPALRESGAWPLTSLRQSFLNGALTRLVDPDKVLRRKIVEFVDRGDFGLASGPKDDGGYKDIWFEQLVGAEEVAFDKGVFLLERSIARKLKQAGADSPAAEVPGPRTPIEDTGSGGGTKGGLGVQSRSEDRSESSTRKRVLRLVGDLPPELWNRLGTKVLPKLRSGAELRVHVDLSATLSAESAGYVESDVRQILEDLGLTGRLRIE